MAAYRFSIDERALSELIHRLSITLDAPTIGDLGKGVKQAALLVQQRAVRNVSGYPVVFEGGVFRVMVRTGALKGAIDLQYPFEGMLKARVFVNGMHTAASGKGRGKSRPVAEYAGAIEWGHGPIDLKKHLMGKTVPFFAAMSGNARGPYAARGLQHTSTEDPDDYRKGFYHSPALTEKFRAQGKTPMVFKKMKASAGGGSYFIAFRKVGKTGWIIPAARPRPFMRAALAETQAAVTRTIADHTLEALVK